MNYLLGASGTGKTTIIEEILKINPDFVTMEGLSRSLNKGFKEVGFLLDEVNKQVILNDLSLQLHNFTHKVQGGIATRGLIDQIVYNKVAAPHLDITNLQTQWEVDVRYCEFIFIVPIEFKMEVDEARGGIWNDPNTQKGIEKDMELFLLKQVSKGLLSSEQIVYLRGSVEQRMEALRKYLPLK